MVELRAFRLPHGTRMRLPYFTRLYFPPEANVKNASYGIVMIAVLGAL
jgi:hypothetical protein